MADSPDIPRALLDEDAERLDAIAASVVADGIEEAQAMSVAIAAEARVLGALMLDANQWPIVSRILSALDFEVEAHQEAYKAIAELAITSKPFDVVSVALHLQAAGRLGDAGMGWLSALTRDTHTPGNAASFAMQMRQRSLARQAQEAAKALTTDLEAGEVSVSEALDAHQKRLLPLQADVSAERPRALPRSFIDWRKLKDVAPPDREWAIDEWLGMGYLTLLAGAGGLGKTLIAQTMATGLSVGRGFCGHAPKVRRVLMLAGEDEQDELHRRQIAICRWMGITFDSIAENLMLCSYKRVDMTLAQAGPNGVLTKTPAMRELREMVADLRADYVILDSSARVYGGNESDRHQVTKFCTWLEEAFGTAGGLLLAHPAKAEGSEYSGSTAWEGSVRTRLFLSRTPPEPDTKPAAEEDGVQEELDGTRYLCRRKANYTDRAHAKLLWSGGLLVPEPPRVIPGGPSFAQRYGRQAKPSKAERAQQAEAAVLAGIERLAATGRHARSAPSSPESLVRRMEAAGLSDGLDKKDISAALSRLMDAGKVQEVVVGKMANRSDDRLGLVLAPPALASESDALAPSVAALALPLGGFSPLGEQEQGESASI